MVVGMIVNSPMSPINMTSNSGLTECEDVHFYDDKVHFDVIMMCYPRIIFLKTILCEVLLGGMLSWIFAVILNSLCSWLSMKLSMCGCNPVLNDTHPFITPYDLAAEYHTNQLGFKSLNDAKVTSSIPEVQEKIEFQREIMEFEKFVCEYRTENKDKGLRNLKNKLKLKDYDEIQMFKAIVIPNIYRFILLGWIFVEIGILVWYFCTKGWRGGETKYYFDSKVMATNYFISLYYAIGLCSFV